MRYYPRVYDALFSDPEGMSQYHRFLVELGVSGPLLDCACGSGDLLLLLQEKLASDGLDIDEVMLSQAAQKGVKGELFQRDFTLPWDIDKQYQTVLCLGDSLNYLSSLDQIRAFFNEVMKHLGSDGRFVFDMHSKDRLDEFEEEYLEEAVVDDLALTWSVNTVQNQLVHRFYFYDGKDYPSIEEVVQTVFASEEIEALLEEVGFKFRVVTDFSLAGYQVGEKYFYICERGIK